MSARFLLLAVPLVTLAQVQPDQPPPLPIPGFPTPKTTKARPRFSPPAKPAPGTRTPAGAKPAVAAKPKAPAPAVAGTPRDPQNLRYPALGPVKLPAVVTHTLPNGLKLFLMENRELPLVRGSALIRAGNLFDPADKVGLAELTGMVLRTGGTKSKTGEQIDEALENVGASVEASIGETSGLVGFRCLSENLDQVLEILKEVITSPEFRQDQLDLAKTQLRGSIARRNDDPQQIATREFLQLLYGKDTPYGWRLEYEHVDRIQRADLAAFHQRYFFPGNVLLAIQGDFSAAEMQSRLEKLFGSWQSSQPPVPAFPEVRPRPAPGAFLAVKTDAEQSFFQVGHLGGRLDDKDYPALAVMADVLGGSFASRLFIRIRSTMGWAYDVSAGWEALYDHPGYFSVSASTKSLSTTQALLAIQEEIEKLRTTEVTAEELERAKESALNSFVFYFDQPSKTLNRLVTYEYFGYPRDFINRLQKSMAAVTAADVLRVAKQHLRPQDLTVVVVGNPKEFARPLEELRMKVEPIDLTIPKPMRGAAKTDAASQARARQVLERMQQAMGGAAKLAAVKDFLQAGELTMFQTGAPFRGKLLDRWAGAHYRQDQEMPFGKLSVYFDGKSGWIHGPQGQLTNHPLVMRQAGGEMFRFPFRLALSDRDTARTVGLAGDGALIIADTKWKLVVELEMDESTGLPTTMIYENLQIKGPAVRVEETFQEWRDVDGIKVPWRTSVVQAGRPFSEILLVECKFNSGIKPEELSKRP